MSFKTTTVLFAVVVAVLVGLIIYFSGGGSSATDGLVTPFTSAGYKTESVEVVEIVRTMPNEQKLVFTKQDNKWVLTEPTSALIETGAVSEIVSALFNAKIVPHPGLSENLAVHGLDKPTLKITLRGKNNVRSTVNIGDTLIGGNDAVTFITTDAKPDRPIAVRASDLKALFNNDGSTSRDGPAFKYAKTLTDFRRKRLLASSVDNLESGVQSIKLSQGKAELELSIGKDFTWHFDKPTNYGAADTLGDSATRPDVISGVRPLLNLLANLQASGPSDYIEGVPTSDFAQYGLAASDANVTRVELLPKSGPREVLFLGKTVEENGKPVVPGKIYARVEGDSAVVKVSEMRLDALAKLIADPASLRSRDLIAEVKKPRIDAIDLKLDGKLVKLRRLQTDKESTWAVYGEGEPRYANRATVDALVNTLTKPRIASDVLQTAPEGAFPAMANEVIVWFDGVGKATIPPDGKLPAEPVTTGTPITLTIGKSQETTTFISKVESGSTTVFQVPSTATELLQRSRLSYIDPKLGTFNTSIANQIAFNRGSQLLELKKASTKDPYYPNGQWTFLQPASLAPNTAEARRVEGLLTLIATSQGARLIAEQATPEQLATWKLSADAPRMRIVVGLTSETQKEKVYLFGTDTSDGKETYFKLADQPFVFLVNKGVYDQFAEIELRDSILFRVNEDKVFKMDFLGWKGDKPEPQQLIIQRTNGTWGAIVPPGFAVDADKVAALLKALEAPRVSQYITEPLGVAVHGLDISKNGLMMVVHEKTDTGEKSILLKLGTIDANTQTIYAESSVYPGQILRLNAGVFKPFLAGPQALGK